MVRRFTGKRKASYGGGRIAKRTRRTTRPKKRGRRGKSRVYTKIMAQPVPDRMLTKLKYSEAFTLSIPTALQLVNASFRTSLFDPDTAVGGHQQLWRDQMATLYNKYRVLGIGYRFNIVNTNVSQLTFGAVKHAKAANQDTNFNTLRERRGVKKFTCNSSGGSRVAVSGYMATGTPHGLTKREFRYDEDFEAEMGNNPVKQSFVECYATTMNTSAIVQVIADLVYYVELTSRVTVAGS